MLDIREVSFTVKETQILENITFSVSPGEVIAVLGEAGSGKSALLSALSRKIQHDGTIVMEGKDPSVKPRHTDILLYPSPVESRESETVFDTVLSGRAPHKKSIAPYSPFDVQTADEMIREFGLDDLRKRRLSELSDSQYKMTILAQFAACQSSLLLLDNPEEALDLLARNRVLRAVRKFTFTGERSVIIATNDLTFASQCADRFIILKRGKVEYDGDHALFTEDMIRKIFGCEGIVSKNIFNGRPEVQFIPES